MPWWTSSRSSMRMLNQRQNAGESRSDRALRSSHGPNHSSSRVARAVFPSLPAQVQRIGHIPVSFESAAPTTSSGPIRPILHHRHAFAPMLAAHIGAPDIIAFDVAQLLFNGIRMPFAAFVEQGRRHGPEAMRSHLVLLEAHPAKRCIERVIGYGAFVGSGAGKQELTAPGHALQLFQQAKNLTGERNLVKGVLDLALRFEPRAVPLAKYDID